MPVFELAGALLLPAAEGSEAAAGGEGEAALPSEDVLRLRRDLVVPESALPVEASEEPAAGLAAAAPDSASDFFLRLFLAVGAALLSAEDADLSAASASEFFF